MARPFPEKREVLRNWTRYWIHYGLAGAESLLVYPIPVRLPCGDWLWTGPDIPGAQIRGPI
jgi:hypothetical protein